MVDKVKHHSFAHLLLMIILFLLSTFVFGGWEKGPLTAGLMAGISVFNLIKGINPADTSGFLESGSSVLSLLLVFLINLVIYYLLSSIIIWVFNIIFGSKKEK